MNEKRALAICPAAELPPGERRIVDLGDGRSIGVFNVKGKYYALRNLCPHAGAELCRGVVTGMNEAAGVGEYRWVREGEILRCPWHGWEFDIRTGQSWCDPKSTKVRAFQVKVEPGEELVKGPYVAETFSVAVEEDYLIIEM